MDSSVKATCLHSLQFKLEVAMGTPNPQHGRLLGLDVPCRRERHTDNRYYTITLSDNFTQSIRHLIGLIGCFIVFERPYQAKADNIARIRI